jgi:hypothetical protein
MTAAHLIEALLSQLGQSKLHTAHAQRDDAPHPLSLDWPELEALLPDGGLPRGVVELSAPDALGGSTSIALAAVRGGQARSKRERGWCAWIDPESTLHAPGVVAAGVDLERLLVVQPPRAQVGRIAVKIVAEGAFEVVVVDMDPVAGASCHEPQRRLERRTRGWAPEVLVRKLALAAEPSGATVLLVTDACRPRLSPWPVALRLELSRPDVRSLTVRVAKEKRGRVGVAKTVSFRPVLHAVG